MTEPRPPFDAELAESLSAMPRSSTQSDDLAARREELDRQMPSIDAIIAGTDYQHTDLVVPGPPGAPDITLAVVHDPSVVTPGPCIYVTHGGGMMFGSPATGAANFPAWVAELGATVVSVQYRLAPEHPFPAGVEDCYAGLVWTAANAEQLRARADRLIVAGASAGGGLAAALCLMARDRGGPAILGQLLTSPMLDDRVDSVSARQFHETPAPWSGADDVGGWTALLGDARGTADVSPYAAPAREQDLAGLPSAFIEVGSAEVFRDEDVDYASRIWAAGGQAELYVWAGAFHGYELATQAAITQESRAARVAWMKRTLADSPEGHPHEARS